MADCFQEMNSRWERSHGNMMSCFDEVSPQKHDEPQFEDEFGLESWPALDQAYDPDYVLMGDMLDLSSLPVYYVAPKERTNKVIIVAHDSHGMVGARLPLVDQFAMSYPDAHVLMPDFFRGESVDNYGGFANFGPELMAWLSSNTPEKATVDYEFVLDWLMDEGKIDNMEDVAMFGLCWGGWLAMKLSDPAVTIYPLKVISSGHPSPAQAMTFGQSEQDLFSKITSPTFLATAGNDGDNIKEGGQLQQILESKSIYFETHDYPEMTHGFMGRGDLSMENVERDTKDALKKTIIFLRRYL